MSEKEKNRFMLMGENIYLIYAVRRFGFADGVRRWWSCQGNPINWWEWAKERYLAWRFIDRRKKRRSGYHTVYAVNRDGDYGLVECPLCNQFQHIHFSREMKAFECFHCIAAFRVYLEDGLLGVRDHREGNISTPAMMVEDDGGVFHLGIDMCAPWWWRRRKVYRDYNPNNGKDGHGHELYDILVIKEKPILAEEPLPEG